MNRSTRRMDLRAVSALASLAFVLASRSALAGLNMPDMPPAIQAAAKMPCTPACTLCHMTEAGGTGTAFKPFVQDLFNVGFNRDSSYPEIEAAIAALDDLGKQNDPSADGDKDGIPDVQELRDGTDPNSPGTNSLCAKPGPVYGCVRVAKPGPVDSAATVASGAVLLLGLALLRRRSR
jgi:hypothetical protein